MTEKSLLSLYIFEILKKYSSKESPLSEKDIKKILNECGYFKNGDKISDNDRKLIPRHANTLANRFNGLVVKVVTSRNHATKWYYNGIRSSYFNCLSQNYFTPDEIGFLIDMVNSNKFLSEDGSKAFIDKLLGSLGEHDIGIVQERRKYIEDIDRAVKSNNEYALEVFRNLKEAIDNRLEADITVTKEAGEKDAILKNSSVFTIFNTKGKPHVFLATNSKKTLVALDRIKSVTLLGSSKKYSEIFKSDLDRGDFLLASRDGKFTDILMSSDTLFRNLSMISLAMKERKYILYKDYRAIIDLPEATEKTVVPIKMILKNGAYYLVGIEKLDGSESSVFTRVDLIDDLRLGNRLDGDDLEKHAKKSVETNSITNHNRLKKISFYIKKEAIQQVADEFGNKNLNAKEASIFENMSGNLKKLGEKYPEYLAKSFTGFEHDEEIVKVITEATEEEALRWALANADTVELQTPARLRTRFLEISENIKRRYSKTDYDRKEKLYLGVTSGKEFLTYGSSSKYEDSIHQRIKKDKAFDKVKKLKITNVRAQILWEELEKYTSLEELIIECTEPCDLSTLCMLPSLKVLTLVNTSIEDGEILAKIPHLDTLFMSGNNNLNGYDFLKELDIGTLYLGQNGQADISPLYELKNVQYLVLEENVLLNMDTERLIRGACRLRRWISTGEHGAFEFPTQYPINRHLFLKTEKE